MSALASGAKKPDAMLSLLSMLIGPTEKPEVVCKSVTVELTLEETEENLLGKKLAQGREDLAEERSLQPAAPLGSLPFSSAAVHFVACFLRNRYTPIFAFCRDCPKPSEFRELRIFTSAAARPYYIFYTYTHLC